MDFILSADRSGVSTNQGKKVASLEARIFFLVPRKYVNGRESTENYHGDLTLYHAGARLTNLGDPKAEAVFRNASSLLSCFEWTGECSTFEPAYKARRSRKKGQKSSFCRAKTDRNLTIEPFISSILWVRNRPLALRGNVSHEYEKSRRLEFHTMDDCSQKKWERN
ncbi:hypothetical protein K0M31_012271 [Melipona bicolor]|uniref:Uncharacterized protein n=1 Tax=Melipona bicolor TaxID=60889 RepID=A0AA40FKR4_9HYME|nr:hypothetical protein K0M31_012271 [Melipona bicolor]